MPRALTAAEILPDDASDALLVGRVWSDAIAGPVPVIVRDGILHDLSPISPTLAGVLTTHDLPRRLAAPDLPPLGPLDAFLGPKGRGAAGNLLAPCDLQPVKAAGVTFAASMIERVIEERARGDLTRAEALRAELAPVVGENLRGVVPGSPQAMEVKRVLQNLGLWSQYLEVGIGPDAEIFTKAPPMASVGCGAKVGIHPKSEWNNPEPEVVLAVSPTGTVLGAALGNDVNLRDVEGRSALLLGKAKDNNASCAIGPFIRLFDARFTLHDVENLTVSLLVTGPDGDKPDGFRMEGESPISAISRSPSELVRQAMATHQYPDGFMLFLGTMFAPTQDRHGPGKGFTHAVGDEVRIASPRLGALVNTVDHCDKIEPWGFGLLALLHNLRVRDALRA